MSLIQMSSELISLIELSIELMSCSELVHGNNPTRQDCIKLSVKAAQEQALTVHCSTQQSVHVDRGALPTGMHFRLRRMAAAMQPYNSPPV